MSNTIDLQVTPWFDLTDLVGDLASISASLGPSQELYVLATTAPTDFRTANGTFPKVKPDEPHDYVVFRIDDWNAVRYDIEAQRWNFHVAQPLPDGELLLVCTRSRNAGAGGLDLNGHVFSEDGTVQRQFLLGDGIQQVFTTGDGFIWTSYFDEGVLGNFGWRHPVGHSGLIKWSKRGERIYEFSAPTAFSPIVDCYALNVSSNNEAWCYYYTDFPLVRVRDERVVNYWECPIRGADGFAVSRDVVLFRGGYDNRNEYVLLSLEEGHQMKEINRYRLVDAEEQVLEADGLDVRGDLLLLVSGMKCYRLYLHELSF